MAKIIDGKELAKKTRENLKIDCENLKKCGIIPRLAVIMVGDNPASKVYVKNKSKACEEVGNELGITIKPGLDLASSEFWDKKQGKYVYEQDGISRDVGEQVEYVKDIIETYGMFYVEDPCDEKDFEGFTELTKAVGDKCLICGDDLFVTNSEILQEGIEKGAGNAIIIKPNQIGSLTETYKTIKLAQENNYVPVVSHRSGETTDETIAHLAVAFGSPMIKTGAIGGERIAKLNELIRIEEDLNDPQMGKF